MKAIGDRKPAFSIVHITALIKIPLIKLRLLWAKRPGDFDLWPLTLKVVSESRVTWAIPVPNLVFLGFSVLDLGPMYTRQTDRRQINASLNASAY